MLLLTTCLLHRATATELVVQAGPWFIEEPAGALRIGWEIVAGPDQQALGNIRITDEMAVDINCQRKWQLVEGRSLAARRYIYQVLLNPEQRATHDRIVLSGLEQEPLSLQIHQRPQMDQAVHVLCAGTYNYPLKSDIARIERQLGHAIDLVMLLGDGIGARIGKGDWEKRIPILCMRSLQTAVPLDDIVCGDQAQWPFGTAWGCIGFPSSLEEKHNLTAINRGLHAWQIFIDRCQHWDPGTYAKTNNPNALKRLLALCRRPQLKLVLTAGSGSGFISEPLRVRSYQFAELALQQRYINHTQFQAVKEMVKTTGQSVKAALIEQGLISKHQSQTLAHMINEMGVDSNEHNLGGIIVEEQGVRYCAVHASGLGFRPLAEEMAVPLYERAHFVLQASPDQLALHVFGSQEKPMSISYQAEQSEQPRLQQAASANETDLTQIPLSEFPVGIETSLQWKTKPELDLIFNSSSFRLHQALKWAHEQGEHGALMTRRLLQLDGLISLAWLQQQKQVDPNALRDCFLRSMGQARLQDSRDFEAILTRTADPLLLRSTLRQLDAMPKQERLQYIDLLMRRLVLQQQGRVKQVADPLLQRDYLAVIFDSPYHSPTPLRPLAVFAQQHFHSVASGPQSSVQRFLDRYGP